MRCSKAVSVFEKIIMINTKMELPQLLDQIYLWSVDLTETKVKHELKLNLQKIQLRFVLKTAEAFLRHHER
ncbi:hypothetical protein H311_02010 [Anncaliia algerae PRA109]|nr:hypothetical protein H311_02010 [Anncaliia algerae PRA109]